MERYQEARRFDPKFAIVVLVLAGLVGWSILDNLSKWLGVDKTAAATLVTGLVFAIAALGIGHWALVYGVSKQMSGR